MMLVKLIQVYMGKICKATILCAMLEVPKISAKTDNENLTFKVSTSKLNMPF